MKARHLRPFVGAPVIVQLRNAMAIGLPAGTMQPAVHVDKDGRPLLLNGEVAPKGTEPKELAFVESWPIAVRKDADGADFRFAIVGSIRMYDEDDEVCELLYEPEKGLHMSLMVDVAEVLGVTYVKSGAKEQSRLVSP